MGVKLCKPAVNAGVTGEEKKDSGRTELTQSYMIFRCQMAHHLMTISMLAMFYRCGSKAPIRQVPFVDDTRYILHCDTIYCNSSVIFDVLNLEHNCQ